jgi:SpoVK/Ycf46/Vps4 family AAA+-type ATPase
MKSDLLKRLGAAIAMESQQDLDKLADTIVEDQKKRGHKRLAEELERILATTSPVAEESQSRPSPTKRSKIQDASSREVQSLPVSRRDQALLATMVPREALEHHIVLPPEIDARFARIEKEFAARERLMLHGLKPRKTILLYGPPGCGKTLAAQRIAWNTGLPLIKVRFDAIVSSYFGESASNLRSVFDAASKQPCVLLLDECDFIARARIGSKDVGEVSRIVNTLLQLMEDYDAPGLLIATTNIEKSLDQALFRRFDDVFRVPLPGKNEIKKLLRMTLSGVELANDVKWSELVDCLTGLSAALVVKAAQSAAKASILAGQKEVNQSHLLEAVSELKRQVEETNPI